ncbi:MAG: cation-translocating P-type ATPase [Longimicrobiaceae bacterium]
MTDPRPGRAPTTGAAGPAAEHAGTGRPRADAPRERPAAASPEAPATWHALHAEAALERLGSGTDGLSEAEAAARLARWGPNLLRAAPPTPAWKILLAQLRGVVVLLLVAALALSLALGDRLDAAAIAVVLLANTLLGFVMELRARRTMEGLRQLEVPRATVVREGRRREVEAAELVPGDLIVVEAGTRIPADARLLSAAELQADEASLTGESLPVTKRADAVLPADAPLAERVNLVHRSTLTASGSARAVVVATGMRTEVGRIGEMLGAVREEPVPLERRLDALGRRLAWVAVGAAAVVAGIGALRGMPAALALETAVALAIAAVPEGLPVVATVALAVGVRRMARRRALVRRLAAVETLGSATVVCTDKTGTLTAQEMVATRLVVDGRGYRVTGSGYGGDGTILGDDGAVARPAEGDPLYAALRIGALANRADVEEGEDGAVVRGDPTEAALLVLARKAGLDRRRLLAETPEVGEIPFSSERMWMATFHQGAEGDVTALVKGAPGAVLERCTHRLGAAGPAPLDEDGRVAVLRENEALAAEGLRVLGLAYAPAVSAMDEASLRALVFVGLVGMMDPPAPGVRETIARLREAGLRTVMITGDQRRTAEAVARGLGLLREGDGAMDGREVDALDDEALAARVGRVGVYSRVSPEAKLRIVSALRRAGEIVAMLGDGVNDAAALKRADIGVAMGVRGTDLARESAGIILQDDRFPTVAAAVEEGRIVFDNIRRFVFYLFSCNTAEVLVVLASGLAGRGAALLPLQILWLNLVTDTFPALALAVEPGEADVMRRRPRDPRAALLSGAFLRSVGFHAATITLATLAAMALSRGRGAEVSRTVAFCTLALAQAFHLGNARDREAVVAPGPALRNPWALLAVGVVVLLQALAVHAPVLRRVLGVTPLGVREWLLVGACAAIPAVVGQAVKLVRGRRAR